MTATENTIRFPFISLEKALMRAKQLFDGDKSGKAMAVSTAFELWGYSAKSSGAFQTTSALKSYGLIDDEGTNSDRKVKLTAEARKYFLDERDEVRNLMLESFALAPQLFQVLWVKDQWSAGIPADTVARSHLKIERNLNDQSARSLLGIFKENIKFCGLKFSDDENGAVEPEQMPTELKAAEEFSASQTTKTAPGFIMPSAQVLTKMFKSVEPAAKPIVFDMETVSGTYIFDNSNDLEDFIRKLEKIKGLLPTKQDLTGSRA
jgi:hypothetical protein